MTLAKLAAAFAERSPNLAADIKKHGKQLEALAKQNDIDKLIAWHQRKSERAVIDYNNARKMQRDYRARATHSQWVADAAMHQDLVIFHRNAVKLLESINHEQTV